LESWIEVYFEQELVLTNLYLYENWLRGCTAKIEAITEDGEYTTVWEGTEETTNTVDDGLLTACNIFTPPLFTLKQPKFVKGVKVTLNLVDDDGNRLRSGIDTIRASGLTPTDYGELGKPYKLKYVPNDGFYGNDTMTVVYVPDSYHENVVTVLPTLAADITVFLLFCFTPHFRLFSFTQRACFQTTRSPMLLHHSLNKKPTPLTSTPSSRLS
jgi:hypothetical protein